MYKKAFLLLTAVFFGIVFSFDADAQTRRRYRRPVRRPAAVKPKPKPMNPTNAAGAVKTATGLTYLITHKGTGRKPNAGETVVVHYTGTLTNGTKFDSSRDRGEPFSFKLGAGQVIKGWDEGIAQLSIGDQAILVIPAALGYGARGAGGVIPPDSTLIFIVELVDIKP